jgi:peptidoglycan-N-acetylglucosamine deacetylase
MQGESVTNASSGKAVGLTFDFDAESLWMGWGARGARSLSRGEFGARVGVPRILDVLKERGVVSTWFVPGHDADMYPELVQRIAEEGHEIGNHGYLHEDVSQLDAAGIRNMILRGNASLERITGQLPEGFRAPAGDFGGELLEIVAEEGFRYDASLKDGEFEIYWARGRDTLHDDAANVWGAPLDLVELPGSWIMQDLIYLERNYHSPTLMGGYTPGMVEEVWNSQLDYFSHRIDTGFMTVTMHPQCIGWGSHIVLLERLIDRAVSQGEGPFITCREAAEEFRKSAV